MASTAHAPANAEVLNAGRWRAGYLAAAAAAAAFVVYGSFVPFDFQPARADAAGLVLVPLALASRTDLASNVLLFLPFPFFLMAALCARRRLGTLTAVAAAVVPAATAGLAYSVEWGQRFLPTRTASWNDVIAAVVAAVVAVALWLAAGDWLTVRADRVIRQRRPRMGIEAALVVYAAFVGLLQALPLDVTIRPAELVAKFKAGRIVLVPFASRPPVDLQSAVDLAGDLLRAVPFGLLGLIVWAPSGTRRSFGKALAVGLALVGAIEAVQLFVFSRYFDVTDLATGGVGVAIGVWAGRLIWAARPAVASGTIAPVWVLAGMGAWVMILLARHWHPFDFTLDGSFVRSRLPGAIGVPFRAYYNGNPFDALNDFVVKALLSMPVGAFLWLLWPPRPAALVPGWLRQVALLGAAAVLFGAIEAGQLLLPERSPDITDVVIGLGGAALGLTLVGRFVRPGQSRGSHRSPKV